MNSSKNAKKKGLILTIVYISVLIIFGTMLWHINMQSITTEYQIENNAITMRSFEKERVLSQI